MGDPSGVAATQERLPLRRPRRRAPVTDALLVALVAAAVYSLHGYEGSLGRDYGLFVYGGEQVANGVPPYVGVFNSVGPLADALPGLAIWAGHLGGADPVLAARAAYTGLSAGCAALVLVLARDVLRSRAAGVVAAAVFLTFAPFLRLASDGPREKTAMLLFLLGALVLLGRRRWWAAGVATALAALTWQPSFLVAAAAAAVALLGAPSRRGRALGAYVLGGAATGGAVAAFYALRGELGTALDGFVTVNLDYTHQPSLLDEPGRVALLMWHGYHAGLVLLVAGLVVLWVRAARAAARATRRDPQAVALVALAAGGLTGTVWTVLVVNGAPDLFELLPFGALGVAAAVDLVAHRVRPAAAARLVTVVVVGSVVVALVESVASRPHQLVRERADVLAVLGAAPPGARVLSVEAPEVPALAQLRNPLPYQLFDPRMRSYLEHTTPGGLATYRAFVARTRPTLVAARHGSRHWLAPVLDRDYRDVGRGPGWRWYVLRSAGPAVAATVRAANASVMGTPDPRPQPGPGIDEPPAGGGGPLP